MGDLVRRDRPRQWAAGSVSLPAPSAQDALEEQNLQAYRIPPEMIGPRSYPVGAIVVEFRDDAISWLNFAEPKDINRYGVIQDWTMRNTILCLHPRGDQHLRGLPPDFPVVGVVRGPRQDPRTGLWYSGNSDRYLDFLAYQRLLFPQGYREEILP